MVREIRNSVNLCTLHCIHLSPLPEQMRLALLAIFAFQTKQKKITWSREKQQEKQTCVWQNAHAEVAGLTFLLSEVV